MAKHYRSAGTAGVGRQACGLSTLALVVLGGVAATACGGRTLEGSPGADGGAGGGGASNANNGSGGDGNANNGSGGASNANNGSGGDGNGNNGNGSGGDGNGNNGNGNNGNVNNGNANNNTVTVTTGADTTTGGVPGTSVSVGGAGGSVSIVTTSAAITTGGMLETGACDAPYYLGSALGRFSGVTHGLSAFISTCGGSGPETFLRWTAPQTGTYRVNTFESEIDTVLSQLVQPNCENLGVVQCSDDINGGTGSELLLYAIEGEVMTFVVDSYYTPGSFQFEILHTGDPVEPCGPVYNELFGVASPHVSQALPLDDSTLSDNSTDQCNGMAPRVAFDWTAPHDGTFTFDTFGSNYDTVLVLRASCNDTLGRVCNDDSANLQSQVSLAAWAGQVVRVEIAAFGGNLSTIDGAEPWITLNVGQL